MKRVRFRHEVVVSIPETLQANTLYLTTEGDVAGHLCACGCGREVITPLSPTDWSITIDRRGASLSPSIGNWAFPCRSHYFIWDGVVVWARDMPDKAVAQGRRRDKERKLGYYERLNGLQVPLEKSPELSSSPPHQSTSQRLGAWWKRLLAR